MRTVLTAAALAIAGTITIAPSIRAQHRDSLSIPLLKIVRVHTTGSQPEKVIGSYGGSVSDVVIVIAAQREVRGVPWNEVRRVDVQVRRKPGDAFGRGARVGAIVFGSAGAAIIIAGLAYDLRGCADCMIPASAFTIPLGFTGTIGGTILGGLIAIPIDYKWKEVWPTRR